MASDQEDNSITDNSLESTGTVVENKNGSVISPENKGPLEKEEKDSKANNSSSSGVTVGKAKSNPVTKFLKRLNIYMLAFILIMLIVSLVVFVIYRRTRVETIDNSTISGQDLSSDALKQLSNNDTSIGDPKQTLNVESNAVFSGKVLIRDSLDVAGSIRVGGPLTLPGITVSGTSNFDQIIANKLNISGDTTINGTLGVQKNLTITGGATFGGAISAPQLNIEKLQLSQDIQLNRHIDAGGGTPRISSGSALGGGGTASVNGTDTAGTVTMNTGSNPSGGVLANVTFAAAYASTPHIVLTPVGSGGALIGYYVTRTSTGFTIHSAAAPGGNTSFSFDYMVID